MDTLSPKCYCNLRAQQQGIDPIGSAHSPRMYLVMEVPLPWPATMLARPSQRLPAEVFQMVAEYMAMPAAARPSIQLLTIAPEAAYSQPGLRRVMTFTRPEGPATEYAKVEYLIPEAQMGALIYALCMQPEAASRFEAYRLPPSAIREIMVCTHGSVDAACGKFGYPLYRHFAEHHAGPGLRVWRVSHFGGHVYAPTFIELPLGHYWAHIGSAQADQIIQRTGTVASLRMHYRGCSLLPNPFLQVAEREAFMQQGWAWLDYPRTGRLLEQDSADPAQWAAVALDYHRPDGTTANLHFRVEKRASLEIPYSSHKTDLYQYPQYQVSAR